MYIYYINTKAQSNGDHELHINNCPSFPKPENRREIGAFSTCSAALDIAKKIYPTADGCIFCIPECHTR